MTEAGRMTVRSRYTVRVPAECVVRAVLDSAIRVGAENATAKKTAGRWTVRYSFRPGTPRAQDDRYVIEERDGVTRAVRYSTGPSDVQQQLDALVSRRTRGRILGSLLKEHAAAIHRADLELLGR